VDPTEGRGLTDAEYASLRNEWVGRITKKQGWAKPPILVVRDDLARRIRRVAPGNDLSVDPAYISFDPADVTFEVSSNAPQVPWSWYLRELTRAQLSVVALRVAKASATWHPWVDTPLWNEVAALYPGELYANAALAVWNALERRHGVESHPDD